MTNNRRVFIGRDNPFICFGQTGTVYPFAVMGGVLVVYNYFNPDGSVMLYPVEAKDVFDSTGPYPNVMP